MTARCLRDKIPKGDFVIRAGVLDRLVENKLYYKFVEYGNRVKDQRYVDDEKKKREEQNKSIANLSLLDDVGDDEEFERQQEEEEQVY